LRKSGYDDTALDFIDWVEKSPLATDAFRGQATYERAVSLAAKGRQSRNADERSRLLAEAALHNLEVHRSRVDDLNVYPVPDGDTGTNLVHTVRGIVEAIEESNAPDCQALAEESRGPLSARASNSGVIFSQIVQASPTCWEGRGVRRPHDRPRVPRGERCRVPGREPRRRGRGTMLTVIREMAERRRRAAPRPAAPELLRSSGPGELRCRGHRRCSDPAQSRRRDAAARVSWRSSAG
jgi:hypothetical protein